MGSWEGDGSLVAGVTGPSLLRMHLVIKAEVVPLYMSCLVDCGIFFAQGESANRDSGFIVVAASDAPMGVVQANVGQTVTYITPPQGYFFLQCFMRWSRYVMRTATTHTKLPKPPQPWWRSHTGDPAEGFGKGTC